MTDRSIPSSDQVHDSANQVENFGITAAAAAAYAPRSSGETSQPQEQTKTAATDTLSDFEHAYGSVAAQFTFGSPYPEETSKAKSAEAEQKPEDASQKTGTLLAFGSMEELYGSKQYSPGTSAETDSRFQLAVDTGAGLNNLRLRQAAA